jgi:glycerophosphoryl diester phosphodiesterase
MKKRTIIGGLAAAVLAALYLNNASWLAKPRDEGSVLAHRGVHQPFSDEGLTRQSCTAAKSLPVGHGFIENTLPSIAEAFRLGADRVEIDIQPTTDGEFVLFHDWTLDCRTEGRGPTREHSLAELRRLDVGYGYTRDGGKTYPLRGTGVGLMPTLDEALAAFPDRRFELNIKSNDPSEADRLLAYLAEREVDLERFTIFGGPAPAARLRARAPGLRTLDKTQAQSCLLGYLALGWSGYVPAACRSTVVAVPVGFGPLFWGWPDRFAQRMQQAGSEVRVGGEVQWKVKSFEGVDDAETLARVPDDWPGTIMTDRIEVIGPLLKSKR